MTPFFNLVRTANVNEILLLLKSCEELKQYKKTFDKNKDIVYLCVCVCVCVCVCEREREREQNVRRKKVKTEGLIKKTVLEC